MEESRREKAGDRERKRQTATIAPVAPEREMPRVPEQTGEKEHKQNERESSESLAPGGDADAELTVLLKQIEMFFDKQARRHDLEAISFTLCHLFSRVDFLYRQALPDLDKWAARAREKPGEAVVHQQVWLHLQAVNRTLDRMAPLCHLLSDVIECLLDTLDNEEIWLRTFEEEETLLLQQVHVSETDLARPPLIKRAETRVEVSPDEAEAWDRAVAALMDRLLIWQDHHHKLVPFQQQFAKPTLSGGGLGQLDAAFGILLDSAGAIFGDILPNFRVVGPEDREETSALLFDLMQQSDQMLAQFAASLEPLTSLIRHFAAASENGSFA
jgi:hypothetical protein